MKKLHLPIIIICFFCAFQSFGQLIERSELRKPDSSGIYKAVDQMPIFPGCEEIESWQYRKDCANRKMLEFIYGNVYYPELARKNGVEGTIVIRFIVNEDGSISDAAIVRDMGAGLGEEGLRVVNEMPDWIPGFHEGKAVKVYFNLPIKFRLEKGKVDQKNKRKKNKPKVDNKAIGQ